MVQFLWLTVFSLLFITPISGETQSMMVTNYIDCNITTNDTLDEVTKQFTLYTPTMVYWNIDMSQAVESLPTEYGGGQLGYFYINGNGINITSPGGSTTLNPGTYTIHLYGGFTRGMYYSMNYDGSISGNVHYDYESYDRSYSFTFNRNSYQDYSMYFPANNPAPGSWTYTSSQALNSINDLMIRSYPVEVDYSLRTGGLSGWWPSEESAPTITIYTCKNGNIVSKIDEISGHNGSNSGSFNLPKDHGVYITVHVGCCRAAWNYTAEIPCYVDLHYAFDQTNPSIPRELRVFDNQDGGVYTANGKTYTNKSPVKLQWNPADDPGDSSPSSGIAGYNLYCNNGSPRWVTGNSYEDTTNPLFSNEGEYSIKIQSKDKEGHVSDPSDPLIVVIDNSVNQVSLPVNSVQFTRKPDGTYDVTFNWNTLQDVSGINKYLAALTEESTDPQSGWTEINNPQLTQHPFTGQAAANTPKYLHIRAIDNLGNKSSWTKTGEFRIWAAPATITATPTATVVNNAPHYQVELQLENKMEAARYVIERTGPNPINPVVLTREQLLAANFSYADTNNLAPHGQYSYSVYTENSWGVPSEKRYSSPITIPNIPATGMSMIIKDNNGQTVTGPSVNTKQLYVNITPQTDLEGDRFRIKLHYKDLDTQITTTTPTFQTADIAIDTLGLGDGNYEFWLEYQETANNQVISNSNFTAHQTLAINTIPSSGSLEPYCIDVNHEANHGTPGQSLNFDVRAEGYELSNLTYQWDFGDGVTAAGKQVTHAYTSLGAHNVSVTISGANFTPTMKQAQIHITNTTKGQLYASETWGGVQPHIIKGDVTVPDNSGIALTISPGAAIRVQEGCGLYIHGSLNLGGAGNQAAFSPYDTGWKGIIFEGGSSGTVSNASISGAIRGLAILDNATVNVSNCRFSNNVAGIHVCGTSPLISSCTFLNNSYGIKEDQPDVAGQPTVTNCAFTGNKVDYYDGSSAKLIMEQLNDIPGNGGNHNL
jgi:hypothetical protein